MILVPLGDNLFAPIDDWNLDLVASHFWQLDSKGYPYTSILKKKTPLHRIIGIRKGLNPLKDFDHVDRNILNCLDENIRECTLSQNHANSKLYKNNTTGFRGVSYRKDIRRYSATLHYRGTQINLGYFDSPESASLAYEKEARLRFGDFIGELHANSD